MDTMQSIVLIGHTFIAIMIIVLVLMQRGKGADAGAAFGSGASGTVFGARGSASFFSRATAVLATAFFATSLALAYMSSQRVDAPESLLEATPDAVIEQPEQDPTANEEAELPVLEENLEQLTGEDELPELGDDERNPQ
jgi:preprotein translocase subunit SecG